MSSAKHIPDVCALLKIFLEATDRVWRDYRSHGPGRLDAQLYDAVATARAQIDKLLQAAVLRDELSPVWGAAASQWIDALRKNIGIAADLSFRCVCTPQGLNFVTGEAGLIPRKDQQDAFQAAINELKAELQLLLDGSPS